MCSVSFFPHNQNNGPLLILGDGIWIHAFIAQSAGAVEYTNCISAEG